MTLVQRAHRGNEPEPSTFEEAAAEVALRKPSRVVTTSIKKVRRCHEPVVNGSFRRASRGLAAVSPRAARPQIGSWGPGGGRGATPAS